jgi:RNA polymerase sigma factor (sigma-70 family)
MDWRSPEFCERFRRGDPAALEEIYWTYVDLVEHVLVAGFWTKDRQVMISGEGDPDRRADLLQEVFVRSFSETARRNFESALDYRAYLLGISRHVLVDHHRRCNRRNLPDVSELNEDRVEDVVADDEPWLVPDVVEVVDRYVRSLMPPLRGLYNARYVLGRSQREAAESLGLSRQNVRTLEERLKEGLRAALEEAWRVQPSLRRAFERTDVEDGLAWSRTR